MVPLAEAGLQWVEAPIPSRIGDDRAAEYAPRFSAAKRDYLAQESRNRSLGHAGESMVLGNPPAH